MTRITINPIEVAETLAFAAMKDEILVYDLKGNYTGEDTLYVTPEDTSIENLTETAKESYFRNYDYFYEILTNAKID